MERTKFTILPQSGEYTCDPNASESERHEALIAATQPAQKRLLEKIETLCALDPEISVEKGENLFCSITLTTTTKVREILENDPDMKDAIQGIVEGGLTQLED